MLRWSLLTGLVCAALIVNAYAALADDPKPKKLVATDTLQVDADFHAQGEYAGSLSVEGRSRSVGVQVIALGNGRFKAVGYWGGLPGSGWDRGKTFSFDGAMRGGTAYLKRTEGEAGNTALVAGKIEFGALTIDGANGKRLGALAQAKRRSPTLGQKPPKGAIVLFDGTNVDGFESGRMTPNGLLLHGTRSRQLFQSHRVHIEFQLPYMPSDRGQGRGNSGCYLQGRYEVQVLDSFGLAGRHNECGGIYSVRDPNVNMCFPPLSWQTYDVDFTAAKFDAAGKKVSNARMTVHHNGVLVHQDVEVDHATTAAPLKEGASPGPLYLQDHDCPLRYRNIWVVPHSQ